MSKVFDFIQQEQLRQDNTVELIASENFISQDIQKALGSVLSNKYAEGYPDLARHSGNMGRYYGGCWVVDDLEEYCCDKWREVFKTDYHVNVQPHSGTQANMAAYAAVLQPGDTILSLDLNCGGHLSHGSKASFSGKLYNIISYNLTDKGYIDYSDLKDKVSLHAPNLVLVGASAYPRSIDFKRIYEDIQEVVRVDEIPHSVYMMVDMAHIAGLIAAGEHPSPFGYADIVTSTTQKTLRGPRGGLVFCKTELAKKVDSAVFPNIQGGPLMHVVAAKAICAEEALNPAFKLYIQNVIKNAQAMAHRFQELKYNVVTGGTDNHLFLLDFSDKRYTGKQVQELLDYNNITVNKNMIPNDKRSPKETSGIRIGTAAMTTKGWTDRMFINCATEINDLITKYL